MPTLISISADGAGRFIGVDHEGQIWRGKWSVSGATASTSTGSLFDRSSTGAEIHGRFLAASPWPIRVGAVAPRPW
jgi:hypothetical protein